MSTPIHCPFCGSTENRIDADKWLAFVVCYTCGAEGPLAEGKNGGEDEEEETASELAEQAVAKWNARSGQ